MEEVNNGHNESVISTETLETEIKAFAIGLPYWGKLLAEIILLGRPISDKDIDNAYSYLLEELSLRPFSDRPEIEINYTASNSHNYKSDLLFTKLENVEGVNALLENQTIEFSPNITIIYGSTGSGKSGYVRLMKKVFYSKAPEEIIQNIHLANGNKPINAKFTFQSGGIDIPLMYPVNSTSAEFEQYAVFDGKSVLKHLDQRNEFEFRPAALNFFADFTEVIKRIEEKLNSEIMIKNSVNEFAELFEGESEIKTFINNLSADTNITDLKKYTPFSEKDVADKKIIEKKYDELLLASKSKEKEIRTLENIKQLIDNNRKNIKSYNAYFTNEYLTYVQTSIADYLSKVATAKAEGTERFKTNKIQKIGTVEWKNFITAAEQFALQQKAESVYPEDGDNCLLCQQPLSAEAQRLIKNYWEFIKSVAEQDAKNAQVKLDQIKDEFDKLLSFDFFPEENILTVWLTEKYPQVLSSLKHAIANQKTLAAYIISDLSTKTANKQIEVNISVDDHDTIISAVDASIKLLLENEQSAELNKLMKEKTKLSHKDKFNTHYVKFETFITNQQWILKAQGISWMAEKRKITDWDKYLSSKYFNQKYYDTFKKECEELKGDFGISISHTGTAGASFRQLFIGHRYPSSILSEGEQKVIALADFLSEMQLSEVNRGIIFDDPVTSLDESRKKDIALRLAREAANKQVIIFTHDLIFVSNLIIFCEESKIPFFCHWIENRDGKPGQVWLRNSPSYEKEYRNAEPAKKLSDSIKEDCPPDRREFLVKTGFAALRTCYEVLVINDLFKNVVQRYNERVSIESLKDVYFDEVILNELKDSFDQCCRYMEGHTHSDKYTYKKPEPKNLNEEIQRYEAIRTKIRKTKKPSQNK